MPRRPPEISMMQVGDQSLRVGLWKGSRPGIPLLLFNGIGGNIELVEPFAAMLPEFTLITFDVPGVGGSPLPSHPYRLPHVAQMARDILAQLGYDKADVLGVSWGGALAQEFTHSCSANCRRLVLAATASGMIMFPGQPQALLKMATPRRYFDKDYAKTIVSDIYGGAFRSNPEIAEEHFKHVRWQSRYGYFLQLFAAMGWTSVHWLHRITQPTLIMTGDDDPIVPPINGKMLQFFLPKSKLWTIDCGHLFLITRAQESAQAVREFLTQA